MNESYLIQQLSTVAEGVRISNVHDSEIEKIHKLLNRFDSLKNYPMVVISEVISLIKNHQESYLPLLSINFTTRNIGCSLNSKTFAEFELVGLAVLKKEYGLVLIRPETWTDKLTEIINPVEIDFDLDEDFSDRFYVLTNDKAKLTKVVNLSFLHTIKDFEGLEIEISENVLLARLHKSYTYENAKFMVDFITQINDGIN
jgi:hypothetical protein